jgi:hypothetical protein
MPTTASLFEESAGAAMRDFAHSRSIGVVKYGNLLARFGKGEVTTTGFGEEALKLALEESARYAQDTIKLGGAWLSFMSQLARAADFEPETIAAKTRASRTTRKKSAQKTA